MELSERFVLTILYCLVASYLGIITLLIHLAYRVVSIAVG
jgi:hypothetical protein